MRKLGFAWDLITRAIELIVILLIIGKATTNFETLLIAVLGLIYITVRGGFLGESIVFDGTFAEIYEEFLRIRRCLKDEVSHSEEATLSLLKEKAQKSVKQSCVDIIFIGIIYLVLLWNIFKVVIG